MRVMRYVIIGSGAAGTAAAEVIRRCDATGQVVMLSDETHPGYYRPILPFLIYDAPEGQNLYRDALHTPRGVDVRLGRRVRSLLPDQRAIVLESGERLAYDRLLLATGTSTARPPIPGLDGPGVFGLRTLDDTLGIKAAAQNARRAVIVGGGRIGVKTALALRHLDLQVTIVEMLRWIIPLQFDAEAAPIFESALQAQGIEMMFGRSARAIMRGKEKVESVLLDNGTCLPADFVVVAAGVRANVELARTAGLATRRGILVNTRLETSAPAIYAAGDVVETHDIVTGEPIVSGIWTNAVAMGQVAGENMAGRNREYEGAFSLLNAMDLAGIPVISAGLINPPEGASYEVSASRRGANYRKLVFDDGRLVGAVLVGEIQRAGVYATLIREHADMRAARRSLLHNTFTYARRLRHVAPDADGYIL